MAVAGDPVESGFVASLARPGGNITGLRTVVEGLYAKRLQLLKQAVPKVTRVGVLWRRAQTAHPSIIELRQGPAERSIEERRNALARRATDLVNLKMDVIFASPAPAAVAAKGVVHTTPVVFTGVSDPIWFGLVASLAKPAGNFTGVSFQAADLNAKRLDLLREAAPRVSKIAALVDRDHPLRERMLKDLHRRPRRRLE